MKKRIIKKGVEPKDSAIEAYVSETEDESLRLLEVVKQTKQDMEGYYPRLLDAEHSDSDTLGRIESFKRAAANITKALAQTASMEDELTARRHDVLKQNKKRRLIKALPSNTAIDESEKESQHFARGLNIYKILLICFVGSFVGVVIELLWCLVTNGYLESRSGLVYGPFNLLYGVGAVALSTCLYKFRNRGSWLSFLCGMAAGSAVEYLCSWGQELLFGSRSWDYSHLPFNVNGRICLLYSIFWGLLGVLWIKKLYPLMAELILKIPDRVGRYATLVLTAFLAVNTVVSAVSVYRWSQRVEGVEPSNGFWKLIDERFDDERMERIYANMSFGDNEDIGKDVQSDEVREGFGIF